MKRVAAFVVRRPWLSLGVVILVLAIGGFLVAASGVMPIKASSRHWAVTEWFLHFAMRRSVVTHAALTAPTPPQGLDDMSFVLRGAGHYEAGCRPCHGAPGDPMPRVPFAMTPHPPELPPRMASWSAEQLFYIVKHGVKFTGMPAWPAQERDDEVWAVVAFLRRLPSLDEAGYESLVRGGDSTLPEMSATSRIAPPDIVSTTCARCHGADGQGRGVAAFPKLAGQRAEYMRRAMRAYARGERHSGIMEPIAAGLSAAAVEEAVGYYAGLAKPGAPPPPASEPARRGEMIASRGVPEDDIPSCADCHLPQGHKVNEAYPWLAGQYQEYLAQQLSLLKQRRRGGSEYVRLMHSFVDRLSSAQMDDVATYFSGAARTLAEQGKDVGNDGGHRP